MNIKGRSWNGESNLINNINGEIKTYRIDEYNLLCLKQNLEGVINETPCMIVKLVYLRRMIECEYISDVTLKGNPQRQFNKRGLMYNYISGIFKNKKPTISINGREMTVEEIERAVLEIRKYILKYNEEEEIKQKSKIFNYYFTGNTLSKVILIRYIIFLFFGENRKTYPNEYNNISSFITDRYHIEMLRLMDLDFIKYDLFPQHIIDMMDAIVSMVEKNNL